MEKAPQLSSRTPDDYWDKSGYEKPQPVIVCAAYALYHPDDKEQCIAIICGARHMDPIMRSQLKFFPEGLKMVDGFIDQFCKFYNREDALEIVKESGQRFDPERNGAPNEDRLFSEGLY